MTITASELGTSSAPATPCSARAATSKPMLGASAHSSEATPKPPTPEREHAPLAVEVAERAADQDQRAERQQVAVDDPLLRRQAAAERALDRRQRDVHDRAVEQHDARADDARDQRQALDRGFAARGRHAPTVAADDRGSVRRYAPSPSASLLLDPALQVLARDLVQQLGVIGAHVVSDQVDDLVLALRPRDVTALAVDQHRHRVVSSRSFFADRSSGFVRDGRWDYVGERAGRRRANAGSSSAARLIARVEGRRVHDRLPGRQGRLLFAYLVLNRTRPARRDELIDALWPDDVPAAPDIALRALLSKLRAVCGDGVLDGRQTVRLSLSPAAFVDVEAARAAIHRAESALARDAAGEAWGPAQVALFTARRSFLTEEEAPWIDRAATRARRAQRARSETYGAACLRLGGTELPAAERAGVSSHVWRRTARAPTGC